MVDIKSFQLNYIPLVFEPSVKLYVKLPNENLVREYITSITGVPVPLKDEVGFVSSYSVVGETPIGAIDGSNAIFTTAYNLQVNTEQIYVNGQRQKKPDDYNISGQTITLTFSPDITENLLIDYIKQ